MKRNYCYPTLNIREIKHIKGMTAAMKLKDAPWKKSYEKSRQCIKKQRHYFADKGPSCQSHSFSSGHVWMWELDHKESWVPKNWCFQIVVLERILRVSWTERRSNQSILKEINPAYSLEGLMLKLKLQYFGHLMGRADSLEKTLMLGMTEGRRSRGRQRMRWLDGTTDSMDVSLSKLQETVKNREFWHAAIHEVAESYMTWQLHNNMYKYKSPVLFLKKWLSIRMGTPLSQETLVIGWTQKSFMNLLYDHPNLAASGKSHMYRRKEFISTQTSHSAVGNKLLFLGL